MVRSFGDNALAKGRGRFSGQNTPLLTDGIRLDREAPVQWIFQGQHFTISNLASHQNLFCTLALLTQLSDQLKYQQAAKEALAYHFSYLASHCGLLRWSGHQFIDLSTKRFLVQR